MKRGRLDDAAELRASKARDAWPYHALTYRVPCVNPVLIQWRTSKGHRCAVEVKDEMEMLLQQLPRSCWNVEWRTSWPDLHDREPVVSWAQPLPPVEVNDILDGHSSDALSRVLLSLSPSNLLTAAQVCHAWLAESRLPHEGYWRFWATSLGATEGDGFDHCSWKRRFRVLRPRIGPPLPRAADEILDRLDECFEWSMTVRNRRDGRYLGRSSYIELCRNDFGDKESSLRMMVEFGGFFDGGERGLLLGSEFYVGEPWSNMPFGTKGELQMTLFVTRVSDGCLAQFTSFPLDMGDFDEGGEHMFAGPGNYYLWGGSSVVASPWRTREDLETDDACGIHLDTPMIVPMTQPDDGTQPGFYLGAIEANWWWETDGMEVKSVTYNDLWHVLHGPDMDFV